MAARSLTGGDSGARRTFSSQLTESTETESVLYIVCIACSKPCRSKTESYSHSKRTGHTDFNVVKILYDGGDSSARKSRGFVPGVNKNMLTELEALGFPTARATRALHYSGNVSLEEAVSWVVEHENDPDLDKMPTVPADTIVETILEELRIVKELRRRLGRLPPREDPSTANPPALVVEDNKISFPVRATSKAEQMRQCLQLLRSNHQEDGKVKSAFDTLLTYVENVKKNPDEEKFRKIRLGNQNFQERVGTMRGGIEFLEVCGFEKIDGGEFLYLPRSKVDMEVLNSAVSELISPINNPFCGIL